jgi:hypothetical protein
MTSSTPFLLFIAGFLLVLVCVSFLTSPLLAAQGGKMEILPIQKAAPAAVVIETVGSEAELRRQMRVKNGVAELRTGTVRFSHAPTGSFGFIAPQSLGMALVMQSPDFTLERVAAVANAYEVHKLADGSGLLVGFMGKEAVAQIKPSERPNNLRISVYSSSLDKAPVIVAVPLIKLMVDRMPIRVDPHKADGPVVLDTDLQSTANRKTPVAE